MIGLPEFLMCEFYSKSLRIRMVEEYIAKRYKEQEMRCPVHLSLGQEANAVAIATALNDTDYMVSTHRGHAHYLAKGGSIEGLLGELYGKSIGCSGGYGGSMHLTHKSTGFLASTSIVGGTIPIGVGAAFAAKIKGENKISAVCIGDAATEEGVFHECANFASVYKLPVVFFIEDNNYSCFTSKKLRQPTGKDHYKDIASAHDLRFLRIKNESFYEDATNLKNGIAQMRNYDRILGPLLVHCDAFRTVEHCGPNNDDDLGYRSDEEIAEGLEYDQIRILRQKLYAAGYLTDDVHEKLILKIEDEISQAFKAVQDSPISEGFFLYA